jgi:hypothetical protein
VNYKTVRRFGAERICSDAKFPLITTVPENGLLKSGYYCRLAGELSNGERLRKTDWFDSWDST